MPKFGDQVRIAPYLGTYYYTFKTDKKPWDDPKLRRAISMAIDRDFLAEKVWKNSMIPAYSFVPPGIAGYEPSVADYADMSQIEREDEAKKILRELGFGPDKPLKMELRFNTSENHQNTAVAVQDMLKPLGVEVSLSNTDTKSHYGMLEQHGDYDVARAGWIADYKDPETFLRLLVTGDGSNYALYSNRNTTTLMSQGGGGGRPGKTLQAAVAGGGDLRPRHALHSAAVLFLPQHRVPEAAGVRGQCDGCSPHPLHQEELISV